MKKLPPMMGKKLNALINKYEDHDAKTILAEDPKLSQ